MDSFSSILQQAEKDGIVNTRSTEARSWFRTKTQTFATVDPMKIIRANADLAASRISIGRMFTYRYSPKYSQELPYYDVFPLVFPMKFLSNGFLGINMHYLPYSFRANLMDALYNIASDDNYDENTKLNISYRLLNSLSRFNFASVVVKRYLNNKITSKLLLIPASEWDLALFMPLERFQKKTRSQVFNESRQKL